jgi:hypothetical protein
MAISERLVTRKIDLVKMSGLEHRKTLQQMLEK